MNWIEYRIDVIFCLSFRNTLEPLTIQICLNDFPSPKWNLKLPGCAPPTWSSLPAPAALAPPAAAEKPVPLPASAEHGVSFSPNEKKGKSSNVQPGYSQTTHGFSFGQVNYCAIINIENNVQSSNFEIETLSCISHPRLKLGFWNERIFGYIWIFLTWRSAMMSSSTSEAQHCCHDSHVPREPYNTMCPIC